MLRPFKIFTFALLLSTVACQAPNESKQNPDVKSETESIETAKSLETGPLEITWEQLMPKGEEDRLEELYSSYYTELERKFQEDIAKAGVDGSSTESPDESPDLASIIAEGSVNDTMDQIGTFNVVEELDGKTIRIPGYVVPFDFSANSSYQEFLLVPYFGACLHTPPPPPNQIVFVKAGEAANIADINEPVWVEGVLKTGRFDSDLANTAYELSLNKVEAYAY